VPDFRDDVAGHHSLLGDALKEAGKSDEAEQSYRRSLELFEALVAASPTQQTYRERMAACYSACANLLGERARFPDALPLRRRAHDLYRQLADESPQAPRVPDGTCRDPRRSGLAPDHRSRFRASRPRGGPPAR
jgi:tetratricopeptide (TPR) repeat protein